MSAMPAISSGDIQAIVLLSQRPLITHLYVFPFILAYPLAAYAYFFRYDRYLRSVDGESQEWTFLLCVTVFGGHALSWLATRWNSTIRQLATCSRVSNINHANLVKVLPKPNKGQPAFCPLQSSLRTLDNSDQNDSHPQKRSIMSFEYQRDHYFYSPLSHSFASLAYPSDSNPPISSFTSSPGIRSDAQLASAQDMYGKNTFNIPIPTFFHLLGEHMQAPFFVFQMFSVGLWFLDEYWYYSLFTLFMLIVFECTTVFQRLRTLNEFRTMSIKPYSIQSFRSGNWSEVMSDQLVPGDLVSVLRTKDDSGVPCDLLLLQGTCIANEAMLSGESTPLLKESVQLRSGQDRLDFLGQDRNSCLFGGTKILQITPSEHPNSSLPQYNTPDGGCLAVVLRTGFGTTQGQLVRTMIFSTEQVTANNMESFLFLAFLMLFAVIASRYVWIKGVERNLKRSKLLLDCIIIITSVVPPELPMELSMAVNASLVALSKFAIFCTEPFRIPSAGRLDVCCFDKTGTITGEDLMVEGVAGVDPHNVLQLTPITQAGLETTLTLASAHALVLLEDGVIGDPMEKTSLEALGWTVKKGDTILPCHDNSPHRASITIRRRFQFSSLLKRMSTVSTVVTHDRPTKRIMASVKGAPEVLSKMIRDLPSHYESTYKHYTRRGSRVLTLAYKFMNTVASAQINDLSREQVECDLIFAGFIVFTCPLKPDAVQTLKMLADSSHRCVMITGDNPLTAIHVANHVEIVDRECLILDVRENSTDEKDIVWRTVDDRKVIPVDLSKPINTALLQDYDLCMTGSALKQFIHTPSWPTLVQNVWVYARVSPAQKEHILTSLRSLGYITLMAGDGTNDVGALKAAHVGVALLGGSPEDLKAIAEHQRNERLKKIWQTQLNFSQKFNQPPPPVPAPLAQAFPELVEVHQKALKSGQDARKANPLEKFNLSDISAKMADMDEDSEGPPQIKLGDASVAAPFTSKLSHVAAISNIIRQGRCTLVATTQMYKILASNCLISAYSLSVQYLDGVKFGDYQMTIQGVCMSACFLCISRAKPVERLSKERPQGSIFNFYVIATVLGQFLCHLSALIYITQLCEKTSPRTKEVDLEAEFEPNLLNSAIYLLSTCQSVATFAVNFQGRPFREDIKENKPLFYGLLGAAAVAFCGATNLVPEANGWLQLVDMPTSFRMQLCLVMILDFSGAMLCEVLAKSLFSDVRPREMITKGSERRQARRAIEQAEVEKRKQEEAEELGEGELINRSESERSANLRQRTTAGRSSAKKN